MKKALFIMLLVVLLTATITSAVFAGYEISPQLIAGQNESAGVVKIFGDANFLTVEFMLKGGEGWCMTESQVHVGLTLADIPQNSGGAIPGQFDYKTDHDGCVSGFTYQIPTDATWYGKKIYIATHAVVIGPDGVEETGWGVNCGNLAAQQFPGNNWSAYIIFLANAWN